MKGYIEVGDTKKKAQYQKWIDDNVPDSCKGNCRKYAELIAEAFKELKIVGVWDYFSMQSDHAWCITEEGEIIDPTAHQFGEGKYFYSDNPWGKEDFPAGKCMWCGDLIIPRTERTIKEFGDCGVTLGEHMLCNKKLEIELNHKQRI